MSEPRFAFCRDAVRPVIGHEHQRRPIEISRVERANPHFGGQPAEIHSNFRAYNHDRSSRLNGQPGFPEGVFSTADDDDALTLDDVADGECPEFTHCWPFVPLYMA